MCGIGNNMKKWRNHQTLLLQSITTAVLALQRFYDKYRNHPSLSRLCDGVVTVSDTTAQPIECLCFANQVRKTISRE